MGIPKYFRSISERFPLINQAINMGLKPEIDCLYLDMNGIVHTATHANGNNDIDGLSEDAMFLQIFQYIEQLIELAEPQKLLYMALDGVAPRAKMNQQRQRRFRSGQALQQRIEQQLLQTDGNSEAEVFDTNCITPGTEFMDRLSAHIQYYVNRRMSEDKKWQKLKVIFSGADSIGEGEHKIMAYIRSQRMQPGYDPNLRHCIYGLDADLIMLSLVTHEHNTVLLREEVVFGEQSDKYKRRKHLLKPGQFLFLHISLFREYINYDLNFAADCDWYDLDRVIDDFVLLSYLAGNDFLPSLPTIRIGLGSLDVIFAVYRQHIVEMGGYLTSFGSINIERLIQYFGFLARHEPALFHVVNDDIARINEFKAERETTGTGIGAEDDDDDNLSFDPITGTKFFSIKKQRQNEEKAEKINDPKEIQVDSLFSSYELVDPEKIDQIVDKQADSFLASLNDQAVADGGFNMVSLDDLDDIPDNSPQKTDSFDALLAKGFYLDPETDDLVPVGSQYTIENYYHKALPQVAKGGKRAINQLCLDYIEGLYWVYKYYYQGVPSWKWQFPHYEAPTLTSLAMVDPNECSFEFDIGTPFTPLQQLMGVLPPQSAGLLPPPLRSLMLNPDSPIADFYPLTFEVDMTGKRWEHEGVAKIPFIDENRLISAMQQAVPNLSNPFAKRAENDTNEDRWLQPNQIRRNINSAGDMLFEHSPSSTAPYSLITGYTQILSLTQQVPRAHLQLYRGNPEKANALYFGDIPKCPVKVSLFVNLNIPKDPQHMFTEHGQYEVDGEISDEYHSIIEQKVKDNPYVLKKYKKDRILVAFEEAQQNDQKYLTGAILHEPTFISTRLLLSQQPLPGYPSLKPILESYADVDESLPIRVDEGAKVDKKFHGRGGRNNNKNNNNFHSSANSATSATSSQNSQNIDMDEIFSDSTLSEGSKPDPNAPFLLFGRPPIVVFGKKSLMPSLSVCWTHDLHVKPTKYKYLAQYRQNDGLNPPLQNGQNSTQNGQNGPDSELPLPPAYTKSYSPTSFAHLGSVAERFSPGRIVWCDFPYLRPGRVEWICDGEQVAIPVSNNASKVGPSYKIMPINSYYRKLYYAEQPAAVSRHKHMLGLQPEPAATSGRVMVIVAPLLEMIQTPDGDLVPVFDTAYHPRKTAQTSSQNGISFQHGNLNPLPGILFSLPQLLWATPPMQPDPRWTKLSRQPTTGLYTQNTPIIGLSRDTFGYIGHVDDILRRTEMIKIAADMVKNGSNSTKNGQNGPLGITYPQLNALIAKHQDMVRVQWTQVPPPVQIQTQVVNGQTQLVERENLFYQIANATRLRFFPAFELARALKITGKTLYRITDSMFFKVGYRQTNFGLQFHATRHSLLLPDYTRYINNWLVNGQNGVDAKNEERSIGDSGDRWEYSNLAVLMIKRYKQAFPELFEFLDSGAGNVNVEGNIDVGQMLIYTWTIKNRSDPSFEMPFSTKQQIPSFMIDAYVKKVKTFLDELNLGQAVMVSTTSKQLNTATVRQFETIVLSAITDSSDSIEVKSTAPGQRGQSIHLDAGQVKTILSAKPYDPSAQIAEFSTESNLFTPQELLLPSSAHPYCPLETLRKDQFAIGGAFDKTQGESRNRGKETSKQQFFKLCDRVMVSRADSRIPLGATGTIIGLHSQFMPMSSHQAESGQFELSVQGGKDLFVEVLLDAPSLVATNLRGKCVSPLGALVPATSILNLTQPVWMLETNRAAGVDDEQSEVQVQQQQQPQQQQARQPKQQKKQDKQESSVSPTPALAPAPSSSPAAQTTRPNIAKPTKAAPAPAPAPVQAQAVVQAAPVQAKPVQAAPVETKPVPAPTPVETKPAPVVQAKPAAPAPEVAPKETTAQSAPETAETAAAAPATAPTTPLAPTLLDSFLEDFE